MSHLAPTESLEREYKEQESLFKIQPPIVQRFLEAQARQVAEVFVQRGSRVHFSLPDRVVVETNGQLATLTVPQNLREQSAKFTDNFSVYSPLFRYFSSSNISAANDIIRAFIHGLY